MATIPVPRSFSQIVGDQLDSLLSHLGIPSIQIGSPILSIIEAAAQSDLRNSQDIFANLNAQSLDRADGQALDRIGADEDLLRIGESSASGLVTITDSSFVKAQTSLFQGQPAPIVGSSKLYVADASSFASDGSVYVGRGTTNYEGPLTYVGAPVNSGSYWTLNLAGGSYTKKYHNLGETVILSQTAGNRTIPAGTVVQTSQGNAGTSLQFTTLYSSTLPDGETTLEGVTVVAKTPGLTGNVVSGSISSFSTPPFTGAGVTNPTPFSNGLATESDDTFRERIRATRKSRSRGTALAIKTGITGITALDENKRVISSSIVTRTGYPTTVYLDDGAGYEEKSEGIALETIVDEALGGEQYFQLANGRPVTKAYIATTLASPYQLQASMRLSVKVGGNLSEHSFSSSEFRSIASASAYEICSSINANSTLLFNARTIDNGTKVVLFAKADTLEDIEIQTPDTIYTDANTALGFPVGRVDSLKLYKNDRLLTKDGKIASVTSSAQGLWGTASDGATLEIIVDGVSIGSNVYTINSIDFVNAKTGYIAVSQTNSLASWAKVLNYKIPGITAAVVGGTLTLTSNRGRSASASLSILGGTLVLSTGMFGLTNGAVYGDDLDYTLDRNLGQIRLADSLILVSGDKLSSGSSSTRAFIESSDIGTIATASTGELWFVVDGAAESIATSVAPSVSFTIAIAGGAVDIVTLTITGGFANAAVGDWAIINDPAINAANRGAWRVSATTANTLVFERSAGVAVVQGATALTVGGIFVIRTAAQLQKVSVPASTYTATSIVSLLNASLIGATASVYRRKVRVKTNDFSGGDIALVASDTEGLKLLFEVGSVVSSETPHLATLKSGNTEVGTPQFSNVLLGVDGTKALVTVPSLGQINSGSIIAGLKSAATNRFGNKGFESSIASVSGLNLTLRNSAIQEFLVNDRIYPASRYALTGYDNLAVVVDGDTTSKRFVSSLYRKLTPSTSTYGAVNTFYDKDNGDAILPKAFGVGMDWDDFAVVMPARAKSHRIAGVDQTNTILWRYNRLGTDGNKARLQYVYPTAPSLTASASATSLTSAYVDIGVTLPSGPARAKASAFAGSMKVGCHAGTVPTAGLYTYTYIFNLAIASLSRAGSTVTVTLTAPSGITGHGFNPGDSIYLTSSSGDFVSGIKTIVSSTPSTLIFTYTEAGAAVAVGAVGTVSADVREDTVPTAVIVDDIFYPGASTSFAGLYKKAIRVTAKTSAYFTGVLSVTGAGGNISWAPINDISYINWFPISGNTTVAIAAAINAQTASPVSAKAIGVGGVNNGSVSYASYEVSELGATTPWYSLTDGINYIKQSEAPAASDTLSNTLSFKDAIDSSLSTNSDWLNEDIRVVPVTTKNIVDFLSTSGPGGLFASADTEQSNQAKSIQITSNIIGSLGSVQVQGGTGNSLTSSIKGSATQVSTSYLVANVSYSDTVGLESGHWMSLDNTVAVAKTRITSATALTSIGTNGVVVLSGTTAWDRIGSAYTGLAVTVEKQGKFVYYTDTSLTVDLSSVHEGDWVVLVSAGLKAANCGQFRVVRTDGTWGFWVENPNASEETGQVDIKFYTYDSIMPGDTLSINTPLWGGNLGSWIVSSIHATESHTFTLDVSSHSLTAVSVPVAGSSAIASLVQVIEAAPSRLIKRVHCVNLHPTDSSLAEVKFDSWYGGDKVGEGPRTIFSCLDKLAFPLGVAQGSDGYRHSTGLIAEANKVGYGDEKDSSTYPGLIAAGANVNIEGPLVRRVQVALSLRIRTGIAARDIQNQVKSAVASVINGTGVGVPVAISDLISAAQSINGVISVTVISPSFGVGTDLISVQPMEKPMVLSLDEDVLVSFVGE